MRVLGLLIILLVTTVSAAGEGDKPVFNEKDFEQLRFLEGRWVGTAPDGTKFYDQYDFESATTIRSRRATDDSFSAFSDGSTVTLSDGEILSTWGEFVWAATTVSADAVKFEPRNAPSSFSWLRKSDSEIEVVQEWTDENGQEQRYSITLGRME